MATTPTNAEQAAEWRELMQAVRERNAKRRENVLRHAENLRRTAEKLRALGR